MSETFLLVDFENVREIAPSRLPEKWRVKVFIGRSQNSVPFAIASEAQRLGDRLEWIKIEGDGRNNLDFHLTFYLGELVKGFPYATFIILTKDKGFDPLLKHLSQRSIQCRRVDEFAEIATASADLPDPRFTRVCEVLSNIHKKFRPKRRKALVQLVAATFQQKLPEADVKRIVDQLFSQCLIGEKNKALTYHF